jgi:hypothetical protein
MLFKSTWIRYWKNGGENAISWVFLYTLHFADDQVVIAMDKEDDKYLCKKLK